MGVPHLFQEDIRRFYIPIPTLLEQRTIVAFLYAETARLDTLVAEQQRLIALLKESRQAVISHAVSKGLNSTATMKDSGIKWLGEIPKHWKIKQLKYLLNSAEAGIQMGPFGGMLISLAQQPTGFALFGQEN